MGKGKVGTGTRSEQHRKAGIRRAARERAQEKQWAARAGEVRVIRPEDLPPDSKLI